MQLVRKSSLSRKGRIQPIKFEHDSHVTVRIPHYTLIRNNGSLYRGNGKIISWISAKLNIHVVSLLRVRGISTHAFRQISSPSSSNQNLTTEI